MLPPPCDELTTSDPLRSATRVSPPGTIVTRSPVQDVGPQVDVARLDPAVDEARRGRERQRRLGDVVARVGEDAPAELVALGGGAVRADQHAVAARLADRLDHQLVEVLEDVAARSASFDSCQVSTLGRIGSSPR